VNVEIVIPTYAHDQPGVAECVENVRRTTGITPIVECRPDLNVAEARGLAQKRSAAEFVCFLDVDAFPQSPGWLDRMVAFAIEKNCGIVSPNEVWIFDNGKEYPFHDSNAAPKDISNQMNVAGMCMLTRQDVGRWDPFVGLKHGFLGGCVEDTDFAHCVQIEFGRSHWCLPDVIVHHVDRSVEDIDAFMLTDESMGFQITTHLVALKWLRVAPDKRDVFFKKLRYLPCGRDQRTLAEGHDILDAYRDIISEWHLENDPEIQRWLSGVNRPQPLVLREDLRVPHDQLPKYPANERPYPRPVRQTGGYRTEIERMDVNSKDSGFLKGMLEAERNSGK
jgi:hypothetical protein